MGIQADKEETRERDDLQKKWSTLKHLNNSQVEAGSVFPVIHRKPPAPTFICCSSELITLPAAAAEFSFLQAL